MKRFILTGAPGSGKTVVLRRLELDGFSVVEEAATDIIALRQALGNQEPWKHPSFINAVADLQRHRQMQAASQPDGIQFHDRSVICTHALASYLEFRISDFLSQEVERVLKEEVFEKRVFFLRNLGFITPTEARRISFEETLRFERIHEQAYRNFGFEIFYVEAAALEDRVAVIKKAIHGAGT